MKKQQNVNNWFTIVELQRNIWGIAEFGHSEKVISYLFIGNSQALLFDTGMGIGDIKKAVKKITNLPILVINSHTHFDHIGGDHQFDKIILFNHRLSQANAKKDFPKSICLEPIKKSLLSKNPSFIFIRQI